MTKGQRTLATLLAIVAALLAAHLLVRLGDQEAQAQNGLPFDSAEPTVVGGHVIGAGGVDRIYQFWSDGTADVSVRFYPDSATCGTAGDPQGGMCGPVEVIP